MLAALEVATTEARGHIQQVLEDIADLSSDEDSPTINTGDHWWSCHSFELWSAYWDCHTVCAWSGWHELMWMRHWRLGNL